MIYVVKYLPTVIFRDFNGERVYDLYSCLLKNRIVYLYGPVDSDLSNLLISQLLFLDSQNSDPISLYINSPGGSVVEMFAILNTIGILKSPIYTYCLGLAASAGAVIFASGKRRYMMRFSRIMIHQPVGGVQGQATDILIQAEEIRKNKNIIYEFLSERTGQIVSKLAKLGERDKYFDAKEAVDFGIADEILDCEYKS